ncbi:hypothetical protein Trydic_g20694 [Trypoxylus dichotomus]
MEVVTEENPTPKRNILSEVNEIGSVKDSSPDELVIIQRGPRCKPETWSPFEFNRDIFSAKDKTPEKTLHRRPEVSARLRRRLTLSPGKDDFIADEFIKSHYLSFK